MERTDPLVATLVATLDATLVVAPLVATLVATLVAPLDAAFWISFTKLDKSDILYGRYFVPALGVYKM